MTDQRPPMLRHVARRLLEHEVQSAPSAERRVAKALASAQVRLHGELAGVVGEAGLHALLQRSVRLSGLPGGTAGAHDPLALDEPEAGLIQWLHTRPDAEAAEAAIVWLSTFLELLSSFIGEGLTLRLINHAWSGELEFPLPSAEKK